MIRNKPNEIKNYRKKIFTDLRKHRNREGTALLIYTLFFL